MMKKSIGCVSGPNKKQCHYLFCLALCKQQQPQTSWYYVVMPKVVVLLLSYFKRIVCVTQRKALRQYNELILFELPRKCNQKFGNYRTLLLPHKLGSTGVAFTT